MFESKYEKAKNKAWRFARTINLDSFSDDELCDLYCDLNIGKWDDRLGQNPKTIDSQYDFMYTVAAMNRIADKVGYKAVAKRYHIRELGYTEQLFEDWYEKQVQKAVLADRF